MHVIRSFFDSHRGFPLQIAGNPRKTYLHSLPHALQADDVVAGCQLAAVRARHHRSLYPKYLDPYAAALIEQVLFTSVDTLFSFCQDFMLHQIMPGKLYLQPGHNICPSPVSLWSLQVDASLPDISSEDEEFDNIATAFMDEQLLQAINLVNMDLEQETRQVVLLGCGLDTRPYRLHTPQIVVISIQTWYKQLPVSCDTSLSSLHAICCSTMPPYCSGMVDYIISLQDMHVLQCKNINKRRVQ